MVLVAAQSQTGVMPHVTSLVFSALAAAYLHPASGQIRVRLYDYAEVPVETVLKAKAFAAETLAAAGVRVEWADCSADPEKMTLTSQICLLPPTPLDLQLRIVNQSMAQRVPTSRHCLGYAVIGARFPSIASVYYHGATGLADRKLATGSSILASIMVHEIGHLLLVNHSHSRQGVMRATWEDEDLRTIAKGRMRFLREERERLLEAVGRRQEEEDRRKEIGGKKTE